MNLNNFRTRHPIFEDDGDAEKLHIVVAGRPNTGKTVVMAKIREQLINLGVPEEAIMLKSLDGDHFLDAEMYEKISSTPHFREKMAQQKFVLHEAALTRPIVNFTGDSMEKFNAEVEAMLEKWDEANGKDVSLEFSTTSEFLDQKCRHLSSVQRPGMDLRIFFCEICSSTTPNFYHVTLETEK